MLSPCLLMFENFFVQYLQIVLAKNAPLASARLTAVPQTLRLCIRSRPI